MEVWKDIEGYEGLYQVSNMGRVKSLGATNRVGWHLREKILKQTIEPKGYLKVGLRKNNKIQTVRVHRLVANAFLPNPFNLPQVNHKDENKTNNHVENLEWCTNKYNNNYGSKPKKSAEAAKRKRTRKTV